MYILLAQRSARSWESLKDVWPLSQVPVEASEQQRPYEWLKKALVSRLPISIRRDANRLLRKLDVLDQKGWSLHAMLLIAKWFNALWMRPPATSGNSIFWSITRESCETIYSSRCLKK